MVAGLQFTTTVTLVGSRQITGYDKGNRPIYAQPETTSPGWVLWPTSLTENTEAQDVTTDLLEGLAPPGTDVDSIQQVKVPAFGAKTYQVVGTPWPWRSPFTGTTPGVGVRLRAVS